MPTASDRSAPAAPGLGEQLRATALQPEDQAAAELRSRLREKMFGVRRPKAPPAATVPPAEPHVHGAGSAFVLDRLGWLLPVGAIVLVASVTLWQREQAAVDAPVRPSIVVRVPMDAPALASTDGDAMPPPAIEPSGPRLLDLAHQGDEEGGALAAALAEAALGSWSIPADPRRIEAAARAAAIWRDLGHGERALSTLRDLLDVLELQAQTEQARATVLLQLARGYEDVGRGRAAAAAQAEARRLDPSAQGER